MSQHEPVTRAEFARQAGVSRTAITKACKPGGALAEAGLPGDRIDRAHPAARAYMKKRGKAIPARAPTNAAGTGTQPAEKGARARRRSDRSSSKEPAPRKPSRKRKPAGAKPTSTEAEASPKSAPDASAPRPPDGPSYATEEDIERYAHLPLSELKEIFGTSQAFNDWLSALKLIEEVREKTLRNDATEGRLIERELVETHVFGAIETSHRRLLGDSPKTIARRIYALARSGTPVEQAEAEVRKVISSQLENVKTRAARVLRSA